MKPGFTIIKDTYAIYQLDCKADMPVSAESGEFLAYIKTNEEVTIVCRQKEIVPSVVIKSDLNWKLIKIIGPLSLNLTGIIAGITSVLADNNVPVFTISAFDTDYVLVKETKLNKAIKALRQNGYTLTTDQ